MMGKCVSRDGCLRQSFLIWQAKVVSRNVSSTCICVTTGEDDVYKQVFSTSMCVVREKMVSTNKCIQPVPVLGRVTE